MEWQRGVAVAWLVVLLGGALTACEREGPAERAGESVDETVERAGEEVERSTDR